jgi:hypothetical protein
MDELKAKLLSSTALPPSILPRRFRESFVAAAYHFLANTPERLQ